jgi:hypothetical protein
MKGIFLFHFPILPFRESSWQSNSKLELVTWSTPANPLDDFSDDMGWGAVIVEEADEHKKKFEASLLYYGTGNGYSKKHHWRESTVSRRSSNSTRRSSTITGPKPSAGHVAAWLVIRDHSSDVIIMVRGRRRVLVIFASTYIITSFLSDIFYDQLLTYGTEWGSR